MKPRGAKAPAGPDIETLAADWAKGKFLPAYLFAGTDTLQKDDAVKRLLKAFFPGGEDGLNTDRFDGESSTAGQILGALRTFSLLGDKRLVLVRRAHELAAAETNQLADGLASAPPANCLVLLWDEKADARSVLVQAVKSTGAVLTFWVPFENQLPRWAQDRAKSLGKSMGSDAAQMLVGSVGPNLPDLAQEIEKLALYVKDKPSIDAADVQALRPDTRTLQFLELDRALWQRDRAKALGILEVLRGQGQPPVLFLSQLTQAYRKLLYAKAAFSEKSLETDQVWDHLRIKSWQTQREFQDALGAFSWDELMGNLEELLKAEIDFKSGRDDAAALTMLVHRLTGG